MFALVMHNCGNYARIGRRLLQSARARLRYQSIYTVVMYRMLRAATAAMADFVARGRLVSPNDD